MEPHRGRPHCTIRLESYDGDRFCRRLSTSRKGFSAAGDLSLGQPMSPHSHAVDRLQRCSQLPSPSAWRRTQRVHDAAVPRQYLLVLGFIPLALDPFRQTEDLPLKHRCSSQPPTYHFRLPTSNFQLLTMPPSNNPPADSSKLWKSWTNVR